MATSSPPDHATADELLDRLRARGARVTTARRLVLVALAQAGPSHPTAEQLTEQVHLANPELHASTIYRTLELLEDLGLVIRAGYDRGATTYHLADAQHHHATCEVCGTVLELPEGTFAPVVSRLRRDLGFHAVPRHLMITGVCAACSPGT